MEAIEFLIDGDSKYVGQQLRNVPIRKDVLITCITRGSEITIADGNSTFEQGNIVVVTAPANVNILQFNDIFA